MKSAAPRLVRFCAWSLLCALACFASGVRADEAAAAEAAAEPEVATPAPEVAPPTAAGADAELEAPAEAEPSAQGAAAAQLEFSKKQADHVRLQLQQLEQDRANPWFPRVTLAVGLGVALLGTIVGAVNTFDCKSACSAPTWVSAAVVGGAAVGALGAIWVVRTDTDLTRTELEKQHLLYELERWERVALVRERALARAAPQLTFRLAL